MSNTALDAPRIRKVNREAIFEYIKTHSGTTKAEIGEALQLSRPTVARLVDELAEAGFLKSEKSNVNTGGRRTQIYSCIPEAVLSAGFQLSSMHIRGVIVDLMGNIVESVRYKVPFHVDEPYRKKVGVAYQELLTKSGVKNENIVGCGVAVHALTDSEGRNVTYYRPSQGAGVEDFSGLLNYVPVQGRLFHDIDTLGYNPELRKERNAFYISIGPRIGGSIILNGDVYHGNCNKPGEFGHIQIERGGRECYCGNKGCFDAYCNTQRLRETAHGELQDFFDGLSQNRKSYQEVWDEYIECLASAVFSLHMVNDATIVIGGELGAYGEYFYQDLCDRVDVKNFFPNDYAREFISINETGEYAVAVGAAMYYIGKCLDSF